MKVPITSSLKDFAHTVFVAPLAVFALLVSGNATAQTCDNGTVIANVVALDTVMIHNRLGPQNPNWFIYALRRDVVQGVGAQNPIGGPPAADPFDGLPEAAGGTLTPGNVSLRPDKRPRPLTLRVAAGQCLQINFENLLAPQANPFNAFQDALIIDDQVKTRFAGAHVAGMQLVNSINDDASFVGANANSTVAPGGTATYTYFAEHEGSFKISNPAAAIGGEASGGNNGLGMWGVVAVEPANARVYRSQVYEEELRLAADADLDGLVDNTTTQGHPIIDYEAIYPNQEPWISEGKAGLPILNANCTADTLAAAAAAGVVPPPCVLGEQVHSEINMIIAGPNADGTFPPSTYPLESVGLRNPTVPNRLEAFREFVSIFHDETATAQAFDAFFEDPVLSHTLHGVRDSFMINYASGGIGSEIIANRLGVGPMYDCLGCAYEEFFLTSFTVGDPGMRVDVPANLGLEQVTPAQVAAQDPALVPFVGPKATVALFQDDPANIHNSYTGDFAKFRNIHAGPKEQHIFHLHNHQWLFNANDDRANYLDAQGIGPGSSYTYEINFGGSGNRNKTAGDAIFHCHFYPHFAQGMWYHWRVHDTTETGTVLEASVDTTHPTGRYHDDPFELGASNPALVADTNAAGLTNVAGAPVGARNRAHPDGEILAGVPITATVPLPAKPMAPMPGDVVLVTKDSDGDGAADSSQNYVVQRDRNPGYPFWIAGVDCGDETGAFDPNCPLAVVGQRPPTPPMDMMTQAEAQDLADNPEPVQVVLSDGSLHVENIGAHPGFVNGAGGFDGGLPRHSIGGCKDSQPAVGGVPQVLSCTAAPALHAVGDLFASAQTRLDFHKEVLKAKPFIFPEAGTDLEKVAMATHAVREHPSTALNLDGTTAPGSFVLNGAPPVPGAPYNEPCVDDDDGSLLIGSGQFFAGAPGTFFQGPIANDRDADSPFVYAAANIQIDAVFNKAGYHYPQQRIIALWGDVLPTINKQKAPEPFVMRLNTFDCAKYMHSNLVPKEFEVDDYQVRTPTDIIGQHIHLPKWDLTTADGAANGWNYEDGTLSPGMVRERIEAINTFNDLHDPQPHLVAEPHPALGSGVGGEWDGGRVTLQRWFADPVVDRDDIDRGLGIIFTHDHYGPSTHQQIGLYSTLLTEPAESTWVHNETGVQLGSNVGRVGAAGQAIVDGGPTSWQAAILPGAFSSGQGEVAFREFYFEFSDFQHAYEAGVYVGAGPDGRPHTGNGAPSHDANGINTAFPVTADSFRNAINPSFRQQAAPVFPDILRYPPVCPGGVPRPCPEAITADDSGMFVVNYRNEPVGLRVFDPNRLGPDGEDGSQADGEAGDLAFALQSRDDRACPSMNVQPAAGDVAVPCLPVFNTGTLVDTEFPPPINVGGVDDGDPFTPLLRAFDGDLVKVKIQAGGHEHEHNATIHGVKWQQGNSGHGPDRLSGGWRNAQSDGISEQFNFSMPVVQNLGQVGNTADYAYNLNAGQDGWWTGVWGILRSYAGNQGDLFALPNNDPQGRGIQFANDNEFVGVCPAANPNAPPGQRVAANLREYDVTAVLANEVLGNALGVAIVPNDVGGLNSANMHEGGPLNGQGTLVYNPRPQALTQPDGTAANAGPLHDPTAILYVRTEDVVFGPGTRTELGDPIGLLPGTPVEPLVLRGNPGECIQVTLRNALPPFETDGQGEFLRSTAPDLAGYNTLLQVVVRDRARLGQGVLNQVTFNNNLIRPSSFVGMHPQLVEYDITQSDGVVVGRGSPGQQIVAPGESNTYQWYAGDLFADLVAGGTGNCRGNPNNQRCFELFATPVELGGSNLSSADKLKHSEKALVGALVIEADGATWDDSLGALQQVPNRQTGGQGATIGTRADIAITTPGGGYEDLVVMAEKGLNMRFVDGEPVPNIAAEGQGIPEDSHDAGQKGVNYGTEPAWFRFGVAADADFGNAGAGGTLGAVDAELMFSNQLTGGADPWTPVFTAPAGGETRMRVLNPHGGAGRGSTFDLHGHVWQRDPYVPEGGNACLQGTGLGDGRTPVAAGGSNCGLGSVAIADNFLGWYLGGQESWMPQGHFDVVLESAGGVNAIPGDYLFRDHGSFGSTDGIWGIVRVQ